MSINDLIHDLKPPQNLNNHNSNRNKRIPKSRAWFRTIWNKDDLQLCKNLQNYPKVEYLIISTLDKTSEKHYKENGEEIQQHHYHVVYIISTKKTF